MGDEKQYTSSFGGVEEGLSEDYILGKKEWFKGIIRYVIKVMG